MPTYRQPGAGPKRIRPGLTSNPGLPRVEPGADKNVKRPRAKTDPPRVEGELGADGPRTRAYLESNLGLPRVEPGADARWTRGGGIGEAAYCKTRTRALVATVG